MQQLTPLSTPNKQKRAIREQIAAYTFDEVMKAWPNSCPVTPAVMCSSLKCCQQTTLSRTAADYNYSGTTILKLLSSFWLAQSCNFNTRNIISLVQIGRHASCFRCTISAVSVMTGSSVVPVYQSKAFSSLLYVVEQLHSLRTSCICSQWQFINNATMQQIVYMQITLYRAFVHTNNWVFIPDLLQRGNKVS